MADSEETTKKQKSPLIFLTGRRKKSLKDKRRQESGFSDSEYDRVIVEELGPDETLTASSGSQISENSKSKSRLAKVFNKYRKIRKSASAPLTSSEGDPQPPPEDTESLTSSYQTPYEGASSGYSTPGPFDNSHDFFEDLVPEENGHPPEITAGDTDLNPEVTLEDIASSPGSNTEYLATTPEIEEIAEGGNSEAKQLGETASMSTEPLQTCIVQEAPAESDYRPQGRKSDDEEKPRSSSESSLSTKLTWKDDAQDEPVTHRRPSLTSARYEFVTGQLTSSPSELGGGARPKTFYQGRTKSSELVPAYTVDSEFEVPEELRETVGDKPVEIINRMELPPKTVDATGRQRQERLYKVLVIGDLGTGKTSIIKRYVHQFFSQHYRATIGVDFALKVIQWDQDIAIRLQLWDIAGQERYGNMTRVYYKEAVGAFIVFDVSRISTFEAVARWKQDLDSKVQLPDGSPVPCVLLANKCDQPKEGIAAVPSKMDNYCKEKGFLGWFETSAKDNVNIDDAVKFLVGKILQNDKFNANGKADESGTLSLEAAEEENKPAEKKSSSCC